MTSSRLKTASFYRRARSIFVTICCWIAGLSALKVGEWKIEGVGH